MKLKILLTICLFCLFAGRALAAEELDLNPWYQLHLIVVQQQQQEARLHYIPKTLQNVTSTEDVFQQVFNYNLEQWKASSQTWKSVDKNWVARSPDEDVASDRNVLYEVRPVETKAAVTFKDVMKASALYQVWNHQAEIRLAPTAKYHGVGLAATQQWTSMDTRSMLVVQLDW